MDIFDMIDLIRRRPGMFIGSNSITPLFHYLNGFQAAELEYGICRKRKLFPLSFRYMHEYTEYRLQNRSTIGWCRQILNSCDGDEEAALQKFFEYYDGFKQVGMNRYWKAILSEDNIAWNDQMKGARRCTDSSNSNAPGPGLNALADLPDGEPIFEPIFRSPLAVYVIELTISAWILAVETAVDVRLEIRFFPSPEKAKGHSLFPEGAEIYFGPIDSWEEFIASNISFDKDIVFKF